MDPDIRWITAVFGFGMEETARENRTHIAVPDTGRHALEKMARELVDTDGLVVLYVPEGTKDDYQPGRMKGKVICAVQLLPMPANRRVEDYFYNDLDGSRRWPVGWPCRLVYAAPEDQWPSFREHVETLHGSGSFGAYVRRFTIGPFELELDMQKRLNRDFAQFPRL